MLQQQLTRILAVALLAGLPLQSQFPAKLNGPKSGGGGPIPPVQVTVTDNFNRANENPLAGNWTTVTGEGAVQIITNQATATLTSYSTVYWNADSFGPKQCSEMTAVTQFHIAYVAVRISPSASTYYLFRGGAGNPWQLIKRVAGATTQIGANYAAAVSGQVVKLCVDGTTLTPYINGVAQTPQTDAAIATGQPGFGGWDTNGFVDNWTGSGDKLVTIAATYFLAPAADGGSDANTGLSAASPWLSPNHPLNCGDTITAKASTAYLAANFANNKWGTVTCPTGDNVAWLRCETFNGCKIAAANVFAMWLSKSHWGVQGWETTGTGNSGVCFGITPTGGATIHHIIIANNVARGCANGISASNQNTTASVDHIAIVGNIAWNATQSTALCNSGITIYDPIKADSTAGTHIYIAGNFAFDNLSPANCLGGTATYDGNGIVLDDIGNVQSGGVAYNQQILVENNISVWNGGYGLGNTGNGTTAAPITYRYNTSAGNLTAAVTSIATCGDMALLDSLLTTLTRNLIVTKGPTGCSGGAATLYAVAVNGSNATTTVGTNWLYSATGSNVNVLNSPAFVLGTNTTNTNPLLTNPVDPGAPNCTGKASVPDCMATLIANYKPQNVSAQAYGYQAVTAPDTVSDPLFPAWLCKVGLPSGLITLHCPA